MNFLLKLIKNLKMESFKVVHWNVLADSLSDGFPYVNPKYLKWQYRLNLILKQLQKTNADIINLVEVDFDCVHYFKSAFPDYFYSYAKKNSSDNKEGVLMLINLKKFKVLETNTLNLLKDRSQVAEIIKIKDRKTENVFNLVGTHLKAKPGFEKSRLKQVETILNFIGNENAIFMADLNDVVGSECYKCLVNHDFRDVYKDKDLKYTTSKKRAKLVTRVIDYIMYRNEQLKVIAVEKVPQLVTLPLIGLPSKDIPSDHVMIGATFQWK